VQGTPDPKELLASVGHLVWSDVHEDVFPTKRPLVAHYTSVETLEKILTTDELWLSNPLFMNDFEELRFGMNLGATEFRVSESLKHACGSAESFEILVGTLNQLFVNFEAQHAIDTFVLSFSEHDPDDNNGRLSMWRGYGALGKGVALVLDTKLVGALPESPLVIAKVEYMTADARRQWVRGQLDQLALKILASDRSSHVLANIAAIWFERLKYFALFTKHDGFKEEQEWRVVYFSDRDRNNLLRSMVSYAITDRGVEPKLKLQLTNLQPPFTGYTGIQDLVDRILLGPGVASELSLESVKKMLRVKNKEVLCTKVRASSIPFRA
jgi:hypothetical protein